MELYQLRAAYVRLENNYKSYRKVASIELERAISEVTENKDTEIEFWQKKWEQDNNWYDTFWFGLATGIVGVLAIVFIVNQ